MLWCVVEAALRLACVWAAWHWGLLPALERHLAPRWGGEGAARGRLLGAALLGALVGLPVVALWLAPLAACLAGG